MMRIVHLALGAVIAAGSCIGAALAQAPATPPAPRPAPGLSQAPLPPARGVDFYWTACSQCHGADGTGAGPVARLLTTSPPDLTALARRNNGAFPFVRVGRIIDGRVDIAPHGGRDMPFWGQMFAFEAGDRFGNAMREVYVQGRVYELVLYLNSIQK